MLLFTNLLLAVAKKKEDPWYIAIFRKIGKEIADLGRDFKDFFLLIKKNTYDILIKKFGSTGVNLVLIMLFVIVFMIIITKIIRGNDE